MAVILLAKRTNIYKNTTKSKKCAAYFFRDGEVTFPEFPVLRCKSFCSRLEFLDVDLKLLWIIPGH